MAESVDDGGGGALNSRAGGDLDCGSWVDGELQIKRVLRRSLHHGEVEAPWHHRRRRWIEVEELPEVVVVDVGMRWWDWEAV